MSKYSPVRRMVTTTILVVIPVVATVLAERAAQNPDLIRGLRMRGALVLKHYADARSWYWAEVASRAATTYHQIRM